MALTNSQYDALMRRYSARQSRDYRLLRQRRETAFAAVPDLKTLEEETASFAVSSARARLEGDEALSASYHQRMKDASRRRSELLREAHFPDNYLDMQYECPDCQDTGYIGSVRCHCFRSEVIRMFYTDSGLSDVLEKENFDHFSLDWYDDTVKDPVTRLTARANMQQNLVTCRKFLEHFPGSGQGLLFYGATGLGKTFLSHCIAKELLDQARSVIYVSAASVFEKLAKETFSHEEAEQSFQSYLTQCDLLIIDDLGTELTNAFVCSALFALLQARENAHKSMVISTNLSLAALRDTYSERIFSRITSSFTLLRFYGDDIRLLKKLEGGRD